MIIAQKIQNRGSYLRYSQFYDSIEDLINDIYVDNRINIKISKLQKFKIQLSKFFNFLKFEINGQNH